METNFEIELKELAEKYNVKGYLLVFASNTIKNQIVGNISPQEIVIELINQSQSAFDVFKIKNLMLSDSKAIVDVLKGDL